MAKIAVVGRHEDVLCYLAAGFAVYEAANDSEGISRVRDAEVDGCAVIFLTPELSHLALSLEDEFAEKLTPAVIPLPADIGGVNTGSGLLKKYVERAVGADIIFRD
ncbi:MAG: V-type ATP synthase subunit F [Clostridia bacterium]|nr:V-type ATP synthase subunit F [Clostridia bacterium]